MSIYWMTMQKRAEDPLKHTAWRFYIIIAGLIVLVSLVVYRLVDLTCIQRPFLLKQGNARMLRVVEIPAHRGMVLDRHQAPLAISTPVDSVWVNPRLFKPSADQMKQLAQLLTTSVSSIRLSLAKVKQRQFYYLKRQIPPSVSKQILALGIPGLQVQKESKRYYPEGAVSAHLVGFTNIDDQGQEGMELAYNHWLTGVVGKKKVVKDRVGHIIDNVALLKAPQQGRDLVLSIDQRIQYLAFQALDAAVTQYHAESGSVIVMNSTTGEVLADVNLPSYNPNDRRQKDVSAYRNRALTDTFEPGSTMKPFTIALALLSGQYQKTSTIDTNPGRMKVGGYEIKDDGLNYGVIDLTQIIQKSSNIGAAKILLSLSPESFWKLLRSFGFGMRTMTGFPGESAGRMIAHTVWYPSDVATLAYGYGIAVTTLQLASAYQVLANDGMDVPVTLLKQDKQPEGHRVLSHQISSTIISMLQAVVENGGTGRRAQVKGYHVAGKTGTAYIAGKNGYDKTQFLSSFVGLAPATRPELVVAVVLRKPQGQHFGGIVAAPAFATIMGGALRVLNIEPDDVPGA